jgi:type III restriction enzyme
VLRRFRLCYEKPTWPCIPPFPGDPHAILDPGIRWFPADEALREKRSDQLMPPLVPMLRKEVKAWRDGGYDGAAKSFCEYRE